MDKSTFEFRGCKPVTIVAVTAPKLKKGCPLNNVVKISVVNGMTGGKYANAVNNAQERGGEERDFIPSPRKWGNRIEGTPLVEHKGKHYLELHVLRSLGTMYHVDGKEVTEEVRPYLQDSPSTPVVWRDYALENIKEVRMDGKVIRG